MTSLKTGAAGTASQIQARFNRCTDIANVQAAVLPERVLVGKVAELSPPGRLNRLKVEGYVQVAWKLCVRL